MKKFLSLDNIDFIGASASILCAIHCIALPVALSLFPIAWAGFLENELFEFGMIALSFLIASISLAKGYKEHGNSRPILWVVLGFLSILGSHSHEVEHNWPQMTLIALGGFAIAFAHYQNWRLTQKLQNTIGREKQA